MKNFKTYISIFFGGLFAGILIFLKIKQNEDLQDQLDYANLEGQESILDDQIEGLEDEINDIEVDDLSTDDVVDYWEDL